MSKQLTTPTWSPTTLGALCDVDPEILGGGTPRDYRFRYIDISSVAPLSISVDLEEMSFAAAPSRARKRVRRDDVLMATVRPNLKAFARLRDDGELVASTGFAILRARPGVSDAKFLEQLLFTGSIESQIERLVAGSNYPAISVANVKRMKVVAPDFDEQRRIANLLSAVDEKIENVERTLVKVDLLRRTLAHRLVTENPPTVRIDDEFNLFSGTTPSRSQTSYYEHGATCWVKTLDLNERELIATHERVTARALQQCGLRVLAPGAVLVAMYGGWEQIGRTAMLAVPACTNQAITALVPKDANAWDPYFVLKALQALRHKWRDFAVSTRKDPNITKSDIQQFLLPSLKPSEQTVWSRRFRALDELTVCEQQRLGKLRLLKRGLASELLDGTR